MIHPRIPHARRTPHTPGQWPWSLSLRAALRASSRERGTVLLMVVGVLALLAIIGVVYATLGRADRTMSSVMVGRQRVDDKIDGVADYLANVVGDSVNATYAEPTTTSGQAIFRTRGYTAPWTDSFFCSVDPQRAPSLPTDRTGSTNKDRLAVFSPSGDCPLLWPASSSTVQDIREYGDPFLCTLEPEWLRFPNASGAIVLANRHDWRNISNFAPSGNFVNLNNLRKTYNGVTAAAGYGGFSAPPGFDNPGQMSYGLTLNQPGNGRPYGFLPGSSMLPNAGGRAASPYIPADWCTNQVWAFRPMVADPQFPPNDHRYLFNQWADTDGDGFADSRWFELVDVKDIYAQTPLTRQVVPAKGRVRLFVAARCVDMSGMVNVNTDDDFFDGPYPPRSFSGNLPTRTAPLSSGLTRDDTYPPGMTAADIDARRLLALTDINPMLVRQGLSTAQTGYAFFPQPPSLGGSDPENYTNYTGAASTDVGLAAYASAYQQRWGSAGSPGLLSAADANGSASALLRKQDYDIFAADSHSGKSSSDYGATSSQRALMSPYDLSDQLELSKFFGVNDSDTFSRLEAAMGGRSPVNAAYGSFSPLRDNRSRSLEMRSRDEIEGKTLFGNGSGQGQSAQAQADRQRILASVFGDVRHLLTTVSGSRPIKDSGVAPTDVGLGDASTDVSYALRVIREWAEMNPPPNIPSQAYRDAVQLIFNLYANALAPYTDDTLYKGIWSQSTNTTFAGFNSGLVYGGNAELALRMAAHMTANLVSAYDRDRPLDATTGRPNGDDKNISRPLFLRLAPDSVTTPADLLNFHKGWSELSVSNARRPNSVAQLPSRAVDSNVSGWMNVYGVEAQPFLTEVSSFFIYTDAPENAGGDRDEVNLAAQPPPHEIRITMQMEPRLDNADFIGEVIAFQLNNPFDQDVILYNRGLANHIDASTFYLEYAGRYYSFGKNKDDDIGFVTPGSDTDANYRLRAGETRVFYVLNPGSSKELGLRIKNINDNVRRLDRIAGLSTDSDAVKLASNWLARQFRSSTNISATPPQQLTQVFPTTFRAVPGKIVSFRGLSYHEMDIWGTLPVTGATYEELPQVDSSGVARRVAQLWRRIASSRTLTQIPAPTTPVPGDATAGSTNNTSNDQLVDRLRDPTTSSSSTLFSVRTPGLGQRRVDNTRAGIEQSSDPATIGDNTGFTAIIWAAVTRPSDTPATAFGTDGGTQDANHVQYRGVLPPWCMEARSDNDWSHGLTAFSLNMPYQISGPTDQGNGAEYGGSSNERFRTLKAAFDSAIIPKVINADLATACSFKTKNPITTITPISPNDGRKYSQVAVEFHSVGEDQLGGPILNAGGTSVKGARSRNPALFSRSGDFLLPLAVGPWFDPSRLGSNLTSSTWRGSSDRRIVDREAQWMTLSESLALACAYYSPNKQLDPYYHFALQSTTAPAHDSLVDRGHLRLDRFTPYFQPNGAAVKQPLGSGVPFALGVIDQFRAAVGISSTPVIINGQLAPEGQSRATAYGGGNQLLKQQDRSSLTLIPGKINLNTGVRTTLSTLPMLVPDPTSNAWWYDNLAASTYNPGAPILFDKALGGYDLAAAIVAYRDHELIAAGDAANSLTATVDFRSPATLPDMSRAIRTRIPDIREGHFIKSMGEVAAINVYTGTTVVAPDPAQMVTDFSMARFSKFDPFTTTTPQTVGTFQRSSSWPQVSSSNFYTHLSNGLLPTTGTETYTYGTQTLNHLGGGQIKDGYQDKLAIVNALTNTASVRSDIFTVYFVVHGYTPEDVDVADDQPLVPSIAKRYVMVVDRSNVVSSGDKPRILMLKEVPMP